MRDRPARYKAVPPANSKGEPAMNVAPQIEVPVAPMPEPKAPDLKAPELYLNRELAQLDFNFRVLAQAQDRSVPLLERLRFMCICNSNLDEFFEVQVAILRHHVAFG